MIGVSVLFAALAASAAPAEPAPPVPDRYTIVVGFDGTGGDNEPPQLHYADDDAARFFLQALPQSQQAWLLTTFDASTLREFPDLAAVARPPTKAALADVLGELAWAVRSRTEKKTPSELVFYFAGHGDVTPAGEGFLVFADGALTRADLDAQVVRGSPTDVNHIILDACASYFMVSPRGEAATGRAPLTPELFAVLDQRGRSADDELAWSHTGVLVSTSDASAVHESADLGGGVFSFLLRSALSGAADINGDGRVEYGEAAAFIAAASADLADPRARIKLFAQAPPQRPNSALSALDRTGSFLAVDAGRRVRILDPNGSPYVELHREQDAAHPVLVALVGHPFFIVQADDREAVLVPRAAGAYALSALQFHPRADKRGVDTGPFARLFDHAYGPVFADAYLAGSSLPRPHAGSPVVVTWASGGAPPLVVPWRGIAVGTFGVSAALGIAAGACAVGNLASYNALAQSYRGSASLDPDLSLQVEAWRTAATVTATASLATALAAGALWFAGGDEAAP